MGSQSNGVGLESGIYAVFGVSLSDFWIDIVKKLL